MSISSEKVFIEKIKEGYRLHKYDQFRRSIYVLSNGKEEITVSAGLIKKLEAKSVIDHNQSVYVEGKRF